MADRSPFGLRTPPQQNTGARSTPMALRTRTMARSPLQSQMATPIPAMAVGISALENEMRIMSQAIQNLTGYVGQSITRLSTNIDNMNQSLSSRIDLIHAGMEQLKNTWRHNK
jgi:hypothetical protein